MRPGEGGIVAGPCPARPSEGGFTIVEMLVAVFIMVLLLGITVRVFIAARSYKARSEKNVELAATARAVGRLIRRDLAGCYMYLSAGAAFDLDISPPAPVDGHELKVWTAAANLGQSEIAEVDYFAEDGVLYRVVNAYKFNETATYTKPDFALAEGVARLEFLPDPSTGWPRTVKVVLTLEDDVKESTHVFTEQVTLPVEE